MDTNSNPPGDFDGHAAGPRGGPILPWREFVQVLAERAWLAVTAFVVVLTLTALWTFRQTPLYQASARIQVDMTRQNVLNMPDVSGTEPFFLYNNYVNTLVREIQSQTFAERVAEQFATAESPALRAAREPVPLIMRAIDARPVKDSRLVEIVAEHADPQAAAALANLAAKQIVSLSLERRVDAAAEATSWLTAQVAEQRAKLAVSETALRDYRDKTRTVSLEQRQDIVVAKLKSISESLTAAEMERVGAEGGWLELEAQREAGTNLQSIAAIAMDPGVIIVRQELFDKRAAASALAGRYRSEHPAMQQAQRDVAELELKYAKACDEARTSIQARYALAKGREDGLRQALRLQEEQALSLDRLLMQYEDLERNADADRQLYDALLTRLKETDLAGKLETNNLRLMDRAYVPERPFRPNKPASLARGAMGGLILGILIALLAHVIDDRVRRIAPGGTAGASLLAVVPTIAETDPAARSRVVMEEPESAAAESFRSLRANLLLTRGGRAARRIMITGTGAGDGKSLVASSLAIVLAANGERVLLIDGDLRRPAVRRAFPPNPAAPHPLLADVKLEDAVAHTTLPTLDVLAPEGPLANPSELLASPRLARLLAATSAYDRVIIDSPPLFSVSDPLLLLPHVDGVILVSRYRRTRHGLLHEAVRSLTDHGASVLGIVLNSVSARDHEFYYGGYYDYYAAQRPPSFWRQSRAYFRDALRPRAQPAAPADQPPSHARRGSTNAGHDDRTPG